jgi:hypothetical protein
VASCRAGLVTGRQLTLVSADPPDRPLCGRPAALSCLKVAGGEAGLGRRRRGGRVWGPGKVREGGALRPRLKYKIVQGHVAVRLDAALHLNVNLQGDDIASKFEVNQPIFRIWI